MATGDSKAPACSKTENLTCTICLELFRSPRLLPCHHTFCLECLQDLASRHSNTVFPCPACRKPAALPAGGVAEFQLNFYLEDYLVEAKKAASTPPQQPEAPTLSPATPQHKEKDKAKLCGQNLAELQGRIQAPKSSKKKEQQQEREIQRLNQELEEVRRQSKSAKKEQDRRQQKLTQKMVQQETASRQGKQRYKQQVLELLSEKKQQEKLVDAYRQQKEQLQQHVLMLERQSQEKVITEAKARQQAELLRQQNESLRQTQLHIENRIREQENELTRKEREKRYRGSWRREDVEIQRRTRRRRVVNEDQVLDSNGADLCGNFCTLILLISTFVGFVSILSYILAVLSNFSIYILPVKK